MGGLGPGIGGFELVVVGLVALLVVGPKDLPVLMRRVGQMVAKARAMANEFRSSFDEMARQSELDDLRKEVEALRSGQGMYPLGKEAEDAFKDINDELAKPVEALPAPAAEVPAMTPTPSEWPDTVATESVAAETEARPKIKRPASRPATAKSVPAKAKSTAKSGSTPKTPASKPKVTRKKAADL
jgi:sec-independent protein translocase protein TatB